MIISTLRVVLTNYVTNHYINFYCVVYLFTCKIWFVTILHTSVDCNRSLLENSKKILATDGKAADESSVIIIIASSLHILLSKYVLLGTKFFLDRKFLFSLCCSVQFIPVLSVYYQNYIKYWGNVGEKYIMKKNVRITKLLHEWTMIMVMMWLEWRR